MATVTLLSWNLESYGPTRLANANNDALIGYIARVIAQAKANIVQLIEVKNSVAANVVSLLVPAIDKANKFKGPTEWRPVIINSMYNNEAYILLYRGNQKFEPILPSGAPATSATPLNGLTNEGVNAAGNPIVLLFPSRQTKSGGRKPFYAVFRTTDPKNKKNFCVVSYHVPYGLHAWRGIERVAQLVQVTSVKDTTIVHTIDATLISGDFNWEYIGGAIKWPFDDLLNLPSVAAVTNVQTSLVNNTPPGGYPKSTDYRWKRYDNIFARNVGAVSGGTVVDLILQSTTKPKGTGELTQQVKSFKAAAIQNGGAIGSIPPKDFEDAWHIVRAAVSNHLPVHMTVTI